MKIALITDTHFGARNDSLAFNDHFYKFWREVFFPYIDEHGIDTVIHERGASLSAGERQLIAISRAFLSKPRVLVLDEATSNLDLQSESQVERALDAILDGRSAIIVAHRLATVMRADRIIVVDNGRIVESGSHNELLNKEGAYSEMHQQWKKTTQIYDS